ncbi:MAG: flagellar hook assembly protein FlgD [Hylemonella sp.]|jgi:flagellar basal-body rod modification protein FlgD|nr:flagellar biosynthesis protein FlgD [Burkholderiaceae bacterium]
MSTSVNDIRIYDPSTAAAKSGGTDPTSTKDIAQNFLKMLTVQLQNQDPLNPMDNAQMTSQLAQLNMVDGVNKLNTTMGSLMAQMQAANFMNLSGSVGKTALAAGSDVYFTGQPVSLAAKLNDAVASLKATITDANGQIIDTLDLGPASGGVTDFFWDGRDSQGNQVASGAYKLQLAAKDLQGKDVTPSTYVGAQVASVGVEGADLKAGLTDGRKVLTTDILKWVLV